MSIGLIELHITPDSVGISEELIQPVDATRVRSLGPARALAGELVGSDTRYGELDQATLLCGCGVVYVL